MRTRTIFPSILLLALSPAGAHAASICSDVTITVDCDPVQPTEWPSNTIGYSQEGTPCGDWPCFVLKEGINSYDWSISASSTDPHVNTGVLPQPVAELFLWLSCTTGDGAAAAALTFETDDPGFQVVGFAPEPFVLNAGTASSPLLAIGGCPHALTLIGTLTMLNVGPVSNDEPTWGGIKALYR